MENFIRHILCLSTLHNFYPNNDNWRKNQMNVEYVIKDIRFL